MLLKQKEDIIEEMGLLDKESGTISDQNFQTLLYKLKFVEKPRKLNKQYEIDRKFDNTSWNYFFKEYCEEDVGLDEVQKIDISKLEQDYMQFEYIIQQINKLMFYLLNNYVNSYQGSSSRTLKQILQQVQIALMTQKKDGNISVRSADTYNVGNNQRLGSSGLIPNDEFNQDVNWMHEYDFMTWAKESLLKKLVRVGDKRNFETNLLNIFTSFYCTKPQNPHMMDLRKLFSDYLNQHENDKNLKKELNKEYLQIFINSISEWLVKEGKFSMSAMFTRQDMADGELSL